MKNKLYIMVGIPGSGKSTYAKKNFPDAWYISRDEIRFNLVAENEEYFSKEDEVFNEFIRMINLGLEMGNDVVADATHLNSRSRIKLFSHLNLNKEKTEIIAVVMRTPLKTCLERNENRIGTRSYVPPQVIKRMSHSLREPTSEEFDTVIDFARIISPKEDEYGFLYE